MVRWLMIAFVCVAVRSQVRCRPRKNGSKKPLNKESEESMALGAVTKQLLLKIVFV
jgi:hypothetical protein